MLQSIATKMLRCKADAEDLVQETFIKWLSVDQEKIQNTKAYLIGAITNTCLNHLNSLKKKKETYIDNFQWNELKGWFKETDLSHLDIEAELSSAFSILMAKLEPLERAVFLLKEVFNMDYEELQILLEKRQDHCRQLLCRARKKIQDETNKINISIPSKAELFNSFKKACNIGDVGDLINDLKKDLSVSFSKK
jgi:RNA polymerase sigma factor (sigma-70 family)